MTEINSSTLAFQIVQKLDTRDRIPGNNKIEDDAWNNFILKIDPKLKKVQTLSGSYTLEEAQKLVATYIIRTAMNQKNVLIRDLGQQWLDKIDTIIPPKEINSTYYAEQMAQYIDSCDQKAGDKKIDADSWNKFLDNIAKKSKEKVKDDLPLEKAKKLIVTYLWQTQKQQNCDIKQIAISWAENIENLFKKGKKNISGKGDNKKSSKLSGKLKTDSKPKIYADKKTDIKPNIRKWGTELHLPHFEPKFKLKKEQSSIKHKVFGIDHSYCTLDKHRAECRAAKDKRLEKLCGHSYIKNGKKIGWSIDMNQFKTDIPYARKNTGIILSYVGKIINENICVTSALGTKGCYDNKTKNFQTSPHQRGKRKAYASHHNAENNKLDFRYTPGLDKKLKDTNLFSRVSLETGKEIHLDVQIKPEVYIKLEEGKSMDEIARELKQKS